LTVIRGSETLQAAKPKKRLPGRTFWGPFSFAELLLVGG
jgi:hypothetical protein